MGTIVEHAQWPPCTCVVTRSAEGGPFYDSGYNLSPGHRAYISRMGLEQAAQAFGLVTGDEHRAAVARLQALKAEERKLTGSTTP